MAQEGRHRLVLGSFGVLLRTLLHHAVELILLVAVPLLLLQANASSPHETYIVDDVCVKTGYSRAAIFTFYKKVKSVRVTSRYIELDDGSRTNHVRLPDSNGGQISDYILSRLPETAVIIRFNV